MYTWRECRHLENFYKRDGFSDFLFVFRKTTPIEKGPTLKVIKFFPVRVDPFPEGRQNYFDRVGYSECVWGMTQ